MGRENPDGAQQLPWLRRLSWKSGETTVAGAHSTEWGEEGATHEELHTLNYEAEYDQHVCELMMGRKEPSEKSGGNGAWHTWPGIVFIHQLEWKSS